jgi:hypothetical protein
MQLEPPPTRWALGLAGVLAGDEVDRLDRAGLVLGDLEAELGIDVEATLGGVGDDRLLGEGGGVVGVEAVVLAVEHDGVTWRCGLRLGWDEQPAQQATARCRGGHDERQGGPEHQRANRKPASRHRLPPQKPDVVVR